jgi:hypothetical protein
MNIYKLKYADKETAMEDLLLKNVYVIYTFNDEETLIYGEGIHAIVEIGLICINNPTKEIAPIFTDGYHYDVMSEQDIDFGDNEVVVNNPKHGFLGHEQNVPILIDTPLSDSIT